MNAVMMREQWLRSYSRSGSGLYSRSYSGSYSRSGS